MTAKDQAIALALAHLTDPNTYDDQKISEAARVLRKTQAQPPAPDCRTCRFSHIGALSKCCDAICTNGDRHEPAPKVVLWRTEP